MGTNTTRLNLYKPGGGSTGLILPDEIADIDKINGNMDLLDAAIGLKNVTSTTRPATPYDGQIIRESDTKNTLVYSSAAVAWVSTGVTLWAATIAAMVALTGVAPGTICQTDGIAGSTYASEWQYVQGTWVPLGPILAVNFAGLNNVAAAVTAAGAGVSLSRANTGALGVALGVTYSWNPSPLITWTAVSGLVPVMATSNSGFATSIGSIYSFTAATQLNLNGIFTSAFAKYVVRLPMLVAKPEFC